MEVKTVQALTPCRIKADWIEACSGGPLDQPNCRATSFGVGIGDDNLNPVVASKMFGLVASRQPAV